VDLTCVFSCFNNQPNGFRDRHSPRINEGISRLLEQSAAVVTWSGDEFDGNYSVKIAIAIASARAREQAGKQAAPRQAIRFRPVKKSHSSGAFSAAPRRKRSQSAPRGSRALDLVSCASERLGILIMRGCSVSRAAK